MALPLNNLTGKATKVMSDVTGVSYLQRMFDQTCDYLLAHEARFAAGAIDLLLGIVIARWAGAALRRALERQTLDPPVRALLVKVTRLLIFGLALTCGLEVAGFPMTAILSGIGVLGVGVGFGMQGLVSNMIAGLTLIVTRPFRVGEYISVLNVQGTVSHIDLVSTTLIHNDKSKVMIPNHKIIGEIVQNYGTVRQVPLSVGVGYQTDLKHAQQLVQEVLAQNKRVLAEPRAAIIVGALQDSSIAINIYAWVKLNDFGAAQSELSQAIVECFRENQIEIPFPQREIRVLNAAPDLLGSDYGHTAK